MSNESNIHKNERVKYILNQLCNIAKMLEEPGVESCTADEFGRIIDDIEKRIELEWTNCDIVNWVRTFEEVNPGCDEAVALRIRAEVEKKYYM